MFRGVAELETSLLAELAASEGNILENKSLLESLNKVSFIKSCLISLLQMCSAETRILIVFSAPCSPTDQDAEHADC